MLRKNSKCFNQDRYLDFLTNLRVSINSLTKNRNSFKEKTTNNAVEKRPTMISVANAATLKVAKFWQKGPAEKSSEKSVQSTNSKYFCKEMNKKIPKNSASIKRRLKIIDFYILIELLSYLIPF